MNKSLLFIDTEFNGALRKLDGHGGELISMGITTYDKQDKQGRSYKEFYEVLYFENMVLSPWVAENVIPILNKNPIEFDEFQKKLEEFLNGFERFTIIADWPDDIRHFCDVLITGPGTMIDIPSFESRVERVNYLYDSKIPHNALEDARALRKTLVRMHEYKLYD